MNKIVYIIDAVKKLSDDDDNEFKEISEYLNTTNLDIVRIRTNDGLKSVIKAFTFRKNEKIDLYAY